MEEGVCSVMTKVGSCSTPFGSYPHALIKLRFMIAEVGKECPDSPGR